MRVTAAVLSLILSAGAQADDVQALVGEGLALIPPFQKAAAGDGEGGHAGRRPAQGG